MALRFDPKRIILVDIIQVELACDALLLLAATIIADMPFKFNSSAGLKSLAIWKDTTIDYDGVAVLFKVRLSLTYFIGILTQVAMHYKTHKLVDDHSLHFDELEYRILTATIRAAHILCHVLPAQHVVANFVCTANRICQDLKTHTACKRVAGA